MIYYDQRPESPTTVHGENPQAEYTLRVCSTDPEADRFTRAAAYSIGLAWLTRNPPQHDTNLWLRSVTMTPVGAVGDIYEMVAVWSKWLGDRPKYSGATTGGTARIRFGRDTASGGLADSNDDPPDFGGGIGFQDGVFQGVDVPVPNYAWTVEGTFPFEFLDPDYRRLLRLYKGRVNDAAFDDFDAGEVRFAGATFSSEEKTLAGESEPRTFWKIQFAFEAQPNMTGLTNNDTLKPIDKGGWEAYWVFTVPQISNGHLIQRPVAHYAVEIFPQVNFHLLRVPNFFEYVTR